MGFSGWRITPVVAQSNLSKHQLVSQTGLSLNPSSAWPPSYEQIIPSLWAVVFSIWTGNHNTYIYSVVVGTKYNHIHKALCVEYSAQSSPQKNHSWPLKEISRFWSGKGANCWQGYCPGLSAGTYWEPGAVRGILQMPGMGEASRYWETGGWSWPTWQYCPVLSGLQFRNLRDLDVCYVNSPSGCLKNEKLPEYSKKAFSARSTVLSLSHVINIDWMLLCIRCQGYRGNNKEFRSLGVHDQEREMNIGYCPTQLQFNRGIGTHIPGSLTLAGENRVFPRKDDMWARSCKVMGVPWARKEGKRIPGRKSTCKYTESTNMFGAQEDTQGGWNGEAEGMVSHCWI